MNKKAISPFTIFFIDIAFLLVWFSGVGGVVNGLFIESAKSWGTTGIEVFILSNMSFIILIVFMVFNVVALSMGSNQ